MSKGKIIRNVITILLLALVFSVPALAQKQTGAIEGWVRDSEGRAIPGATVTASSPSLIGGSLVVQSSEDGRYRFPYLAPGTYEVKAQLTGFQAVVQTDIRLFLGTTLTVNFALEFGTHAENVEIIDSPPLIDRTTTETAQTLSYELLQSLPNMRKIQDILAMTPGVRDVNRELDDSLKAFGADGEHSNSIWIDGVNAANPREGFLAVNYNYNWIEEVHVTGIGAPAEYGGFTGVLANYTTRSGGNQFHGLFETLFQNENLVGTNRPDADQEVPFQNYDISAQLGGPIIRNRLWFFTGLQYIHNEIHPFNYDGTTTEKTPNYIGKLNFKLDDQNSLQGFFQRSDYRGEKLGADNYTQPEAFSSRANTQVSWNTTWISLPSSQTNIEARIAGYYDDSHPIRNNPNIPGHVDWFTGIRSGNVSGVTIDDRSRFQANIVLSHYASDFLNAGHEFRFGTEFERSTDNSESYMNGGMYYADYNGGPMFRYSNTPQVFDATSHRVSLFLQDDLSLTDNLKLSLGMRWDHNSGNTDRGNVFRTDPIAPRVGFVWTLNDETQTVLKAHYGDYYDALLGRSYYFLSDTANYTSTQERFVDGEWVVVSQFDNIYYSNNVNGANFRQPRVRQFTIGLDRMMPGGIPVGAHYIYRRFGNALGNVSTSEYEPVPFVHPITGETITVYSLIGDQHLLYTNIPGAHRQYHGLEIYASKQLTNRFLISSSFVYSKTTVNRGEGVDPNSKIFPGVFVLDTDSLWKIVGTYSLPLGFKVGGYFHHENRGSWSPIVQVNVTRQHVPLGGAPGTFTPYESNNILDLRVEKEFPIATGQFRLTADIFNVFNGSYVMWVYPYYPSGRPLGQPLIYNNPRQFRLGVRYTF